MHFPINYFKVLMIFPANNYCISFFFLVERTEFGSEKSIFYQAQSESASCFRLVYQNNSFWKSATSLSHIKPLNFINLSF